MSSLSRGAIFLVAALAVGLYTYASATDLDRDGALGTIIFGPGGSVIVLVVPLLAIALVNRWWTLSLALVPLAVEFFLHEATEYVYPFHEDPYPAISIFGTAFLLVIYSLGFVLRAAFDWTVSEGWAQKLRDKLS